MKYRGGYTIKDLRRDLDGGLGWAHSTESVANYLEAIIPSVREAKIKGSFRHTSSQDKTDPKKVLTTSFYKSRNIKLATCHAHGDGTWSIAFTTEGREELKLCEVTTIDKPQLDVHVRAEIKGGLLYHYGEMKSKPQACRRYVALNNDDVHREHQADSDGQHGTSLTLPFAEADAQILCEKTDVQEQTAAGSNSAPAAKARGSTLWSHYQQGRPSLDPEQMQLAADLAKEGLTKKEERLLFAKLKAMPWEQQEQILKQSKLLKTRADTNT